MKQRAFGPGGAVLPIVGQGTWHMEAGDRNAAIDSIRRGIDAGMTHIDTAELYGHGDVESLVGEAIRGRRDELYLVSKVLPSNATRDGTILACKRSLEALGTDHLDLYLLHWEGDHPLADTIAAFDQLVSDGLIRAYGVSNFDADDVRQVVALAGPGKIACNQVLYHLKERAIEHYVIPTCEELGVAVVAYSPFGSGDFPAPRSAGGVVLAEIATEHSATPHQVALAFLARREPVFVIPKTSRADRAAENAAAGDLALTETEIARIDRSFPLGRPRRGVPYL